MVMVRSIFHACVCVTIAFCSILTVNGQANQTLRKQYSDLFSYGLLAMAGFAPPKPRDLKTFSDSVQRQIRLIQTDCPKDAVFSTFSQPHMQAVMNLELLLKNESNAEKAFAFAKEIRTFINPKVWISALERYALYSNEMKGIEKPSSLEVMPDEFIPSKVLLDSETVKNGSCAVLDEKSYTGAGAEENKLWYFREDLMANSHHWHYHIAYPLEDKIRSRPDRRGELFYYIHHALLARYRAERIANGLADIKPLEIAENAIIAEGYKINLKDDTAGKSWSDREANSKLIDVTYDYHDDDPSVKFGMQRLNLTVINLMFCKHNVLEAVKNGYLIAKNGSHISLNNFDGIDWLAEVVENTAFEEINSALYGEPIFGFHNSIHTHIGLVKDPYRNLELAPGPLAQSAVAIRDPVFYRIHAVVDEMFNMHKAQLPPYQFKTGDFPILANGIKIDSVQINTEKVKGQAGPGNEIRTFWENKELILPHRGADMLDGEKAGPFHICVKHLNHEKFSIQVDINRSSEFKSDKVTVRVYLAPRLDCAGNRFSLKEQFKLFFPLFITQGVSLKAGSNKVILDEDDSDVIIQWPQALSRAQENTEGVEAKPYCGCGWPQHLLLPRGSPEGSPFDLVIVVTNWEDDKVSNGQGGGFIDSKSSGCKPAFATCGIPGEKYPDRKPMGFPFDRKPNTDGSLEDWISGAPNIKALQIKIKFSETRDS